MGDATLSVSAIRPQLALGAMHCQASHGDVEIPREGADSRRWVWRSTQLEPGELHVDCTVLDLGNAVLSSASINRASLHRLRAPAACVSLLLRSRGPGALFVRSHELTADQGICVEAGREVELIAHRESACVLISINKAFLMQQLGTVQLTGSGFRSGFRAIGCSMGECEALEGHVRSVMRSGSSLHSAVLLQRVGQLAAELLFRPVPCPAPRTAASSIARLERGRRCAAVELARQYIQEHLTEPMHLADLCSNTHLQARSLEYGFREVVRLSPMRYVRMLRLGEVRRQLSQVPAAPRSISEIALDAGFSHLSQFTVDYKKIFGETPSTTRRRALDVDSHRHMRCTGMAHGERPDGRPTLQA